LNSFSSSDAEEFKLTECCTGEDEMPNSVSALLLYRAIMLVLHLMVTLPVTVV
jgi:hypothetical protein